MSTGEETTSVTTTRAARLRAIAPILSWFPHYDRGWWSKDVIAGLTL